MDWLIPRGEWFEQTVVALAAAFVTALVVVIHYEGLHWLSRRYSGRSPEQERGAMLRIIFALLGLHIVEVWCYGIAYWLLLLIPGTGSINGEHGMDHVFDAIYLSATVYTTLGLGDLTPIGAVRLLSGLESLTGFLLITWSASFSYLEMSRYWNREQ
jgi:hypothetical protein